MQTETAALEEDESQQGGEPERLRRWTSPFSSIRLALWRLGRSFRLLLAVGFGILIAVVLICTVPLYSSLVTNVQLQHQLSIQTPPDINVEVDTTLTPANSATAADVIGATASAAGQYLNHFAPTATWYMRLEKYFPPVHIDNKPLSEVSIPLPMNPQLQPYVLNLPQALPHMDILSGRLPRFTAANQTPEILAVKKLGLKPGDTISIPFEGLTMKVVGVWTPRDDNDPYWNGNGTTFDPFFPPCIKNCSPNVFPVIFNQTTFFDIFSTESSNPPSPTAFSMSVHYISFTVPGRITVATSADVIQNISLYRSTLNGGLFSIEGVTDIGVGTNLDNILGGLEQQAGLLELPLYIIISQLVGLALLFVIAMATLLIEAQAGEIATLKSRGASRTQLLVNYSLQGLLVTVAAALVGPFLAAGLSILIVRYFVPAAAATLARQASSSPAVFSRIVSPWLVLWPAVVGAGLGLLALVIAAWFASRHDVLAFRRESGRQERAPFWQRLYLDVGLAVIAAVGYLELGEFGGLNIRQQLGQTTGNSGGGADPLQLVAPVLLLLAGALLILRLFPLATRAGAWLATLRRGATGMLAFAQLDRASSQFARLALLLSLSIALGIFALTFQTSLRSNTIADTNFLVGCDQRVVLQSPVDGTPPTAPFQSQFAAMPGVEAITPVYRSLATSTSDSTNVDILGIDPTSFAKVVYWNSDYASQPLASLLAQMQAHTQGPLAGDQQHPIWALIDTQFADNYRLSKGVVFTLDPQDSPSASLFFEVEAVVAHFPTLGAATVSGQVIFNLADFAHALTGPLQGGGYTDFIGPNEYWLRTTASPSAALARTVAFRNPNLWVQTVINRATIQQQAVDDPLTSGMTGLLVIGACIAAVLALIGSVIQSGVGAAQRMTQFAILRTLGGQRQQLVRILLGQQLVIYGFGLVAGTALGVLLSTATLPFLQFSTTTVNTTMEQLPPFALSFNLPETGIFYAALLLAFALALLIGIQTALRGGLGQTLRIGED
jgi:ABC-type lipoprotein release transport system permease subunit